jgi:4-hydroxybenzoate polyprenyltransferase
MNVQPQTALTLPRVASTLNRHLRCVRFDEVLVLQGAPGLGAAFAIGALTWSQALPLAAFVAGSCALVAHVFLYNDLSGIAHDLNDPQRARDVFVRRGIETTTVDALCVASLILCAVLLSFVGLRTVVIAMAIAALSALYSGRRWHMKSVAVGSTVCHLVGGALHFLLGYSVFSAIDGRALAIAPFFGLMFAAGHLTQETRDRDADRANGVMTNAVAFGGRGAFLAGLALFALAHLLLFGLAVFGVVPRVLVAVLGCSLLHSYWARKTLASGLTYDGIRDLRQRYRLLYAFLGLLMLTAEIVRATSVVAQP